MSAPNNENVVNEAYGEEGDGSPPSDRKISQGCNALAMYNAPPPPPEFFPLQPGAEAAAQLPYVASPGLAAATAAPLPLNDPFGSNSYSPGLTSPGELNWKAGMYNPFNLGAPLDTPPGLRAAVRAEMAAEMAAEPGPSQFIPSNVADLPDGMPALEPLGGADVAPTNNVASTGQLAAAAAPTQLVAHKRNASNNAGAKLPDVTSDAYTLSTHRTNSFARVVTDNETGVQFTYVKGEVEKLAIVYKRILKAERKGNADAYLFRLANGFGCRATREDEDCVLELVATNLAFGKGGKTTSNYRRATTMVRQFGGTGWAGWSREALGSHQCRVSLKCPDPCPKSGYRVKNTFTRTGFSWKIVRFLITAWLGQEVDEETGGLSV